MRPSFLFPCLPTALWPLRLWIERTVRRHAAQSQPVADLKFARLGKFFSRELLARARVVAAPPPMPPMTGLAMRLGRRLEPLVNPAGITFLDTYFIVPELIGDESIHFHEMIHVIQWETLGPKLFLQTYARGILEKGYRDCPLETMAYDHEARFDAGAAPYNVEAEVRREIARLIRPPLPQ